MLRRTQQRFLLIGSAGVALASLAGCGWLLQLLPQPSDVSHETLFTENLGNPDYQGTQTCLTCHSDHATDIMETAHWNWGGAVANVAGLEGEIHGKVDFINNY